MYDYLFELLNISAIHIACLIALLCPMWESRNVNIRFVCIYLICFAAAMCAMHLIARQFMTMDLNNLRSIRLCFAVPVFVLPFIIYRKQMRKTVFIIAMGLLCYSIISAMTLFAMGKDQPDNLLRFTGTVDAIIGAIILPSVLLSLRQIHTNPNIERMPVYWRIVFLLPALFAFAVMVLGNYTMRNGFDAEFLILLIVAYGVSISIIYIYEALTRFMQQKGYESNAYEQTGKLHGRQIL